MTDRMIISTDGYVVRFVITLFPRRGLRAYLPVIGFQAGAAETFADPPRPAGRVPRRRDKRRPLRNFMSERNRGKGQFRSSISRRKQDIKQKPEPKKKSLRAINEDPVQIEKNFVEWLLQNGARFPKLEWPVFSWPGEVHDGERGVRVTEYLEPGEEMFRVPGSILFNREKCLKSEISAVFRLHREALFSDRDELALTLLLLFEKLEKGRESFWWPMVAALPADPGSSATSRIPRDSHTSNARSLKNSLLNLCRTDLSFLKPALCAFTRAILNLLAAGRSGLALVRR
jgi:hypothetical protein